MLWGLSILPARTVSYCVSNDTLQIPHNQCTFYTGDDCVEPCMWIGPFPPPSPSSSPISFEDNDMPISSSDRVLKVDNAEIQESPLLFVSAYVPGELFWKQS